MLRADAGVKMAPVLGLKGTQRITAKNIHFVPGGDVIPQLLKLNRRVSGAQLPQRRVTLSADGDAGVLALGRLSADGNEIPGQFHESRRVGCAVDQERRERLCSIERDKPAVLNSGAQAVGLQSRNQSPPDVLPL